MVVSFCDGGDDDDDARGILIHFRMNNQKSAYGPAWIHDESGIFEWERQPFCVTIVLVWLVREHKVPHGCAVGFLGERTVSKVPLHYLGTVLGLSAVRQSSIVVTAACRGQVEEDPETRSGNALTIRRIARRCLA